MIICKICELNENNFKKSLAVDHNHITGEIRGLLCYNCNSALGQLKADNGTDLLEKAINYIKNYSLKKAQKELGIL